MIEVARTNDPQVAALLRRHPRVTTVESGDQPLVFRQNHRERSVLVGNTGASIFGLLELIDNNPVVCADTISVPSPTATLALIALGPIIAASILVEPPVLLTDTPEDETLERFLEDIGWSEGVVWQSSAGNDQLAVATVMANIKTPEPLDEIDQLYADRFSGSFFIHADEDKHWSETSILDSPHAFYRLRITPDEPNSLLTVHVVASPNGKCGAAQIIHAMNVMAGYEETLGLG